MRTHSRKRGPNGIGFRRSASGSRRNRREPKAGLKRGSIFTAQVSREDGYMATSHALPVACATGAPCGAGVSAMTFSLRKEVIQPQVLLRLPCYDFTPIMSCTLDGCPLAVSTPASSTAHFRDVTGGVYKARERIHRGVLIRDY
jgi:hypothetical protein